MTRSLSFGLALLAVCALASESQAFGRRSKSGCSGGSCGVVSTSSGGCWSSSSYTQTNGCSNGKCDFAPATAPGVSQPPSIVPLPKAPSNVGGYPAGGYSMIPGQQTADGYSGILRPGMTIMTPDGPRVITSVSPPTPVQTASPMSPPTPPTIRRLPEPEPTTQPQPDTRPKAPRNDDR